MLHRDPYKSLPTEVQLFSYGTITASVPCWAWAVMDGPNLRASGYGTIDDPKVNDLAAKQGQQVYMQAVAVGCGLRWLESEKWSGELVVKVHSESLVAGLRDNSGKALLVIRRCRDLIDQLSAGRVWDAVSVPWECLTHVFLLANQAHTEWSKRT